MKISDIQRKDIINITDGRVVGRIIDLEITSTGVIEYIIIEKNKYIKSLFTSDNIVKIKYNDIKKIGDDVILVEL